MPQPTIVYQDVDITLNPNPITSDILQKTGASAIIQALSVLVQYGHYEKPFHPEIGANIRQLLFELPDSNIAGLIEKEIRTVVNNFEPRVNLLAVAVEADQINDGYNITVEFTVASIPNPIQISSFLERVR
jgi:phage baseplate assembly protein W